MQTHYCLLTSISYSPSPNIWLTLGFVRLALSLFDIWGLLRVNGYKSIGYRVTVGVLLKVVSVGHLEAVKLVADDGDADNGVDDDDGDNDHFGDADKVDADKGDNAMMTMGMLIRATMQR